MDYKLWLILMLNKENLFQGDNNSKYSGSLKTHWAINVIYCFVIYPRPKLYWEPRLPRPKLYCPPPLFPRPENFKYCILHSFYITFIVWWIFSCWLTLKNLTKRISTPLNRLHITRLLEQTMWTWEPPPASGSNWNVFPLFWILFVTSFKESMRSSHSPAFQ